MVVLNCPVEIMQHKNPSCCKCFQTVSMATEEFDWILGSSREIITVFKALLIIYIL